MEQSSFILMLIVIGMQGINDNEDKEDDDDEEEDSEDDDSNRFASKSNYIICFQFSIWVWYHLVIIHDK